MAPICKVINWLWRKSRLLSTGTIREIWMPENFSIAIIINLQFFFCHSSKWFSNYAQNVRAITRSFFDLVLNWLDCYMITLLYWLDCYMITLLYVHDNHHQLSLFSFSLRKAFAPLYCISGHVNNASCCCSYPSQWLPTFLLSDVISLYSYSQYDETAPLLIVVSYSQWAFFEEFKFPFSPAMKLFSLCSIQQDLID